MVHTPRPMTQLSEAQLVDAVQSGDQTALGRLLQAQQDRLYNVCLRMLGNRDDAAEIAQDAMVKIVEHIGQFKGQSAISTWTTRIAMNLCLSHLRKRKLRKTVSLDGSDGQDGHDDQCNALRHHMADQAEPGPAQRVQQKEMIQMLHQAMGMLDDDYRAILVLRDIDQMDYQQIADVLTLASGTVKSRLFRARLALRKQVMSLCNEPDTTQPFKLG